VQKQHKKKELKKIMPNRNGKGPYGGKGRKTGRKLGNC